MTLIVVAMERTGSGGNWEKIKLLDRKKIRYKNDLKTRKFQILSCDSPDRQKNIKLLSSKFN